ncbi:MAG: TetR/AcrR family transcriptional regulator [Kiritimatiellae bacterium]|nr:TetR/AcrR family transcriptional regulator [Kiritimatiellia bacterium]
MHVKARSDGERTRAAIVAAAEEEFAENGYQGTSVRAIAKRAGANAALAIRYFGSKEELYMTIARRLFGDLAKPMVGLAATVTDARSWKAAVELWVDDFLYMATSRKRAQRLCASLFRHEVTHPSRWAGELKTSFGKPVYDSLRELLAMSDLSGDAIDLLASAVWAQICIYALADGFWLRSFRPAGMAGKKWACKIKEHICAGIFARAGYAS